MRNAAGEQVSGIARTVTIPRQGEQIVMRLVPKERCGRRMKLVVQDPQNLIEGVEIDRSPYQEVVSV